MNNIINLETIDSRVTAMSERVHANGTTLADDPEFPALVAELMESDHDDLMVLLGSALAEADALPTWLTQGLENKDG